MTPVLNESAITIPEELSKYLDYALRGDFHWFVVNLVASLSVSSRRHIYVEKLEIFDDNGYCHQFQHVDVNVLF